MARRRLPIIAALLGMLLLMALGGTIMAAEWGGASYEVVLPSSSSAENERRALFKQGMEVLLGRIAPGMAVKGEVSRALEQATHYVERYAYEEGDIRIQYNAVAIRQLLEGAGQTLSLSSPPVPATVMVWLAVDRDQQRHVVGEETDPILREKVLAAGRQKGIALVVPQMDLEDLQAISADDIWGYFPSVWEAASQRYEAKAWLVGRLQVLEGERWRASWQYKVGPTLLRWEHEANSVDSLLLEAMGHLSKAPPPQSQYTEKIKGVPGGQTTMVVGIANVHTIRDFMAIEADLEQMDGVSEVTLVQVEHDRVIFEVSTQGQQDSMVFRQVLGERYHYFQDRDTAYHWAS